VAGYDYLRDELQAHVSHLGGVSDKLDTAASRGAGAGAPPGAYGLIGSFIPALLQPLVERATRVTSAGRESLVDTGAMMRRTLENYDQVETDNATAFRDQEQKL